MSMIGPYPALSNGASWVSLTPFHLRTETDPVFKMLCSVCRQVQKLSNTKFCYTCFLNVVEETVKTAADICQNSNSFVKQ